MKSKNTSQILMTAAIAGILGASAGVPTAMARTDEAGSKGRCMGANSCKGTSACKTAKNECSGQNGCKSQGFLEMSKEDCMKARKQAKDKKIKNRIKFE